MPKLKGLTDVQMLATENDFQLGERGEGGIPHTLYNHSITFGKAYVCLMG